MLKMSSFFLVLLFLLVSCNKDSDLKSKGERGQGKGCIKKVADDGCNICTFLRSSEERPNNKRAKDKTAWSCTEKACDTPDKEPGECLKTREKKQKTGT